jgi:predicted nucleic acid-binding protein
MQVFLDTNIFLYAAGASHPWREACAKVLRRVADGSLDATINSEVQNRSTLHLLAERHAWQVSGRRWGTGNGRS